jgi:predicted phosphodiesterase
MMRLLIMSDLHLEFEWPDTLKLSLPHEDQYDAVVLAGDIDSQTRGIEWAAENFRKHVVYVPGNHEFYGTHQRDLRRELHKIASQSPHVHLLDDATFVLADPDTNCVRRVRFVGATLWTNFKLFGGSLAQFGRQMNEAKHAMLDFELIGRGSGLAFRPADSIELFNASVSYIGDELRNPFDGATVVVTHHLPSMKSVVDRYRNDLLSAAFASHLDRYVEQADLWVHGHTHDRLDYWLGKCRVVCHPRGYPSEQCEPYAGLIVEV